MNSNQRLLQKLFNKIVIKAKKISESDSMVISMKGPWKHQLEIP